MNKLNAIAIVMVIAFSDPLFAAPNLKSDSIDGELRILGGRDPVLIRVERMPEGNFSEVTYWLVFADEAKERDTKKMGEGVKVKVTGTVGRGGQYRYVIVERVMEVK